MVKIDFGSGIDQQHYTDCISQEDCLEPKPTMYPPSAVQSVTTEDFATRAPEAYEYVSKRAFTNAEMNGLLAWMEDNQADGPVIAEHYLKNNEAQWSTWVSAEAAVKIKAALK